MTTPRIYSADSLENKTSCELGEDNLKYLKQVMRLKPGDTIHVFDGFGRECEATIATFLKKTVLIELGKTIPAAQKEINITVAQALPKAKKMDAIVKSAAELGADAIIPFQASRSVGRIGDDKTFLKVSRWQKIATEAARSSHSAYITDVFKISSFAQMLSMASRDALKLIFWEEELQQTIKGVLTNAGYDAVKDYFAVVGPEGGFSRDEIEAAKSTGFIPVTLGRQILKVETAAAAIITIIQYEKGIFSKKRQEGKNDFL